MGYPIYIYLHSFHFFILTLGSPYYAYFYSLASCKYGVLALKNNIKKNCVDLFRPKNNSTKTKMEKWKGKGLFHFCVLKLNIRKHVDRGARHHPHTVCCLMVCSVCVWVPM